jgi:hypothetical protein
LATVVDDLTSRARRMTPEKIAWAPVAGSTGVADRAGRATANGSAVMLPAMVELVTRSPIA